MFGTHPPSAVNTEISCEGQNNPEMRDDVAAGCSSHLALHSTDKACGCPTARPTLGMTCGHSRKIILNRSFESEN